MNLKTFKIVNKLNNIELAKSLKISTVHLSLIMNDRRKPSINLLKRIMKTTRNQVQPNDFFPDELEVTPEIKA